MNSVKLCAAVLVFVSVIAFALYGADKKKAVKGKWRIKESVLLLIGLLGGGTGALLAMKLFHHKTRHWYFWVINSAGAIMQLLLLLLLAVR